MKIASPYNPEINNAIKDNLPDAEFVTTGADITLPVLPLPLRLGDVLDFIGSHGTNIIILGPFKINVGKSQIECGGKAIELTEKELQLLQYLGSAKATVFRDDIIKNVWGYSDSAASKTVENHIYRLRNKVNSACKKEIIVTDGSGYKLIEY